MPRFTVCIVNFNGGDYVQGALDSLARQNCRDFEVFLVDNASSDGSIDDLKTDALPAYTLMAQERNLGFAEGNNVAAKEGTGEWFVLLNPDAEAAPDWLERIDAAIQAFPEAKMFASAQYNLHQPDELDGAGDAYLIFGFPWRGGFGLPASALPGPGECFSPCGAGAVYHRQTYLAHGGFDERFFCFCEDVDLGYRMRLAGEICRFLPDAVIHHAGGGLSGRASDFSVYHGARNRIWTYWKNTPALLLALTAPGHVALSAAILARGLVTGRFPATWRGMVEGVRTAGALRKSSDWSVRRRECSLWRIARAMAWNPLRMLGRRTHIF